MSYAVDSKHAQTALIDGLPEPSEETGPGSHFGSTFAPAKSSSPPSGSKSAGVTTTEVPAGRSGSPKESFPSYRAEAFADYKDAPRRPSGDKKLSPAAAESSSAPRHRRTSSLKERYPGDTSVNPLDMVRRDSRKANRSNHLHKRSIPGADMVDRLDPAVGGIAYHHEGPYDAAMLSRNRSQKYSPVAALETSNREALKATPQEHLRDALDRHKPLDGVATVPPGQTDQFGRTYNYEEGTDLMHEGMTDAGYKQWPGKEYDPADKKGVSEPAFSLDRALQAHKIDDNGIEMEDRAHLMDDYRKKERRGTLDKRDPVDIAGGEAEYAEMERNNAGASTGFTGVEETMRRSGSLKQAGEGLKKRFGSLKKKVGHSS